MNVTKKKRFSTLCYYTILFFIKILSLMPYWMLYVLSDILFFPLYYLIRYRRKIVRKNLTETFPQRSISEIIQIEKNFYHFFVDMILESCKLISVSSEEIKQHVKFTNIEIVNNRLAEGKSISLFLGHFGNWEWISSIGFWLKKDVVAAQIYHKLRNQTIDKIMKRLRERTGNVCVDMYNTVRFMVNASTDSRPYIIGFIADQSPKKREIKHFLRFLNHDVPVLTGSEKATKHFGYEAIFLGIKRVKRGYYECEFTPIQSYGKSLPDFELTNIYFNLLEKEIYDQPELYLWTHNRFKYAIYSNN